jgi:hypothetical protein
MLDPLDHFIKGELRLPCYVRYCDDFAVFSDDKRELWEVRGKVQEKLWALRLRLNEGKSRVRRTDEGITFLGFHVRPGRLRVKREGVRRFSRRLLALKRGLDGGTIDLAGVSRSVQAWLAHAQHADSRRLREALLSRAVF